MGWYSLSWPANFRGPYPRSRGRRIIPAAMVDRRVCGAPTSCSQTGAGCRNFYRLREPGFDVLDDGACVVGYPARSIAFATTCKRSRPSFCQQLEDEPSRYISSDCRVAPINRIHDRDAGEVGALIQTAT